MIGAAGIRWLSKAEWPKMKNVCLGKEALILGFNKIESKSCRILTECRWPLLVRIWLCT